MTCLFNSFVDSGRITDKNVLKLHKIMKKITSSIKRGLPKDEENNGEDREGMFSFLCDEKKRKPAEKRYKSHKDKQICQRELFGNDNPIVAIAPS